MEWLWVDISRTLPFSALVCIIPDGLENQPVQEVTRKFEEAEAKGKAPRLNLSNILTLTCAAEPNIYLRR